MMKEATEVLEAIQEQHAAFNHPEFKEAYVALLETYDHEELPFRSKDVSDATEFFYMVSEVFLFSLDEGTLVGRGDPRRRGPHVR